MRKSILSAFIVLLALSAALGLYSAEALAEKGKLYFTFVSSAYYMDKKWGQGTPLDGIKRTAEIAHRNGVPVTWLVSPRSASEAADLFREYHEKYGDAVGYIAQTNKSEEAMWGGGGFFMSKLPSKKLFNRLRKETDSIKKSLPWAELMIAGGGHRSNRMVKMLEKLGYTGLWGHCWEQTLTDGISDRGAPWGFYYVSDEAFKAPNRKERGLVAIEWTARDLNLAFRTGKPEIYSTDPNDVGRAALCSYRSIEYWKRMVDEYARNAEYNMMVPLAVHQEAHEMEDTPKMFRHNSLNIASSGDMLDELFKYVKSIGAEIVSANDAIKMYRGMYEKTPPTYALFKDTILAKYPEILVYFDLNGQLFFDRGKISPVFIRNYIGANDPDVVDFAGVTDVPEADCKSIDTGYECSVSSDVDMAYGLAFWGNYSNISVEGAEGVVTKILPGQLAHAAWPLKPGMNRVRVNLN